MASDARLVSLVREGRAGAFDVLYDRHYRGILTFCRHMLGDQHEAEDAAQHTFMAAYSSLLSSHQLINLRPWLFAIARNRCYSVLRSQRERPTADVEESATEGLSAVVQRRQDLRDLVLDLGRLPEDQRAALVLAELESLSHAEIAAVLSVPRDKVKALVFQARESLMASRTARDTTCHEIRQQLSVGRGGALRRSNLRRHLRDCEGCRAYRTQVQHQRRQFAILLPVAPTLLAKEGLVVAAVGAGGAAAVGGSGLIASSALKTGLLKGLAAAIVAGAGTLGTVVVSASNLPMRTLAAGPTGSVLHARSHHRAAVAHRSTAHASIAAAPRQSAIHVHRVAAAGRRTSNTVTAHARGRARFSASHGQAAASGHGRQLQAPGHGHSVLGKPGRATAPGQQHSRGRQDAPGHTAPGLHGPGSGTAQPSQTRAAGPAAPPVAQGPKPGIGRGRDKPRVAEGPKPRSLPHPQFVTRAAVSHPGNPHTHPGNPHTDAGGHGHGPGAPGWGRGHGAGNRHALRIAIHRSPGPAASAVKRHGGGHGRWHR